MFFYNGLSCPHCQKPFSETDDIVACPVCGAPHHRDCWNELGNCACAADHGTDKQWSRDKAQPTTPPPAAPSKPCPYCHTNNVPYAEFCSHCGKELTSNNWQSTQNAYPPPPGGYHEYAPFHVQSPYGGVSPDTKIEDESARDIAAVVVSNTSYYLPRFERLSRENKKISFNLSALLFTPYWLFYRKQYALGTLVMVFNTLMSTMYQLIFFLSIELPCMQAAGTKTVSYDMLVEWVMNSPAVHPTMFFLGMILLTLALVGIFFGLFGNWIYMQSCAKRIDRARQNYPEGYQAQLSVCGGTSLVLVLVAYMCYSLCYNLLSALVISLL